MTTRTTASTVTFNHPFVLGGLDEELPAGTYTVETDEDLLEGLSFTAYRRSMTMIHLPRSDRHPGRSRTLSVSAEDLDAALERDRAQPMALSREGTDGTGVDSHAEARAENEGMTGNPK